MTAAPKCKVHSADALAGETLDRRFNMCSAPRDCSHIFAKKFGPRGGRAAMKAGEIADNGLPDLPSSALR